MTEQQKSAYEETTDFVAENLTDCELWGQLAEEAVELAQAALKMQRLFQPLNAPRKPSIQCVKSVIEEHADVVNAFHALRWNDKEEREEEQLRKMVRWASNVKEKKQTTVL